MDFFGILFDMKNGKKIPYSKNYFDTLFAENLAGVTTLTGTLPLTFTTSETKLRSWTIYGADIEHIETASGKSITFHTDEDKLRDWTIFGNADGVGERTKNLIEITTGSFTDHGVTFTFDAETGIVVANGKATGGQGRYAFYIKPTETLNLYLSGCPEGGSDSTYNIYPWDATENARPKKWDGTTSQTASDYGTGGLEVQAAAGHRLNATIRIEEGYTADNLVFKPMYRLSDTSADFIPYGYEIPISVNGTPQDIYIGDSPLTAGESVSKTSTGVDIATADGNNTITTTLYNQPDMSITYNEFTGVGEYVDGQWQIPLTVSDGTNTATVNVPIEAPLTEGQSVTDTLTINTFEGENTVETTLENKPQMSITYKGG